MENETKYTFRTLNSTDIFPVMRIVRKIGINKFKALFNNPDMQAVMGNENAEMSNEAGISLMLELAQLVLDGLDDCEKDIYELLERTSNKTIEEIKNFDVVTFTEMLIDFFKKEELKDFLRAVFTALNVLKK